MGFEEAKKEVVDPLDGASVKKLTKMKYMAIELLLRTYVQRHDKILCDMDNDYMKGEQHYLKDVSSVFKYLTIYQRGK